MTDSERMLIDQGCGATCLAGKLSERFGIEVCPLDVLDLLAEAGYALVADDGSNHARRAWDRARRREAIAA